jgi:hypothetical protein
MTGAVIVDANLTLLLVVGSASPGYIAKHKRLRGYSISDFELLGLVIAEFSEIILLPHVLAEVSNLARQIAPPARGRILDKLRSLIESAGELSVPSLDGATRREFQDLGLTDAVILCLCGMTLSGIQPTLVTSDGALADSANSQGYSVIDYRQDYQNS